ncbi:hypothetical protein B0H14DRAFT_3473068 [Mycena olivaceomarginata]|nr:hypothetical protein B0H14DRAFT_3473068 [Mycena olivaceomarginata]
MPETREIEASYLVLKHGLVSLTDKGTSMALESIEIDAADKECSHLPKDHLARQGLPHVVDSPSTIKWGTNKSQTYVYPEMWWTGGKAKSNMPVGVLTDLSLGVSYTHWGLILNLGPLSLMVQWLTHTSVQLYSRTVNECLGSASEDVFTHSSM